MLIWVPCSANIRLRGRSQISISIDLAAVVGVGGVQARAHCSQRSTGHGARGPVVRRLTNRTIARGAAVSEWRIAQSTIHARNATSRWKGHRIHQDIPIHDRGVLPEHETMAKPKSRLQQTDMDVRGSVENEETINGQYLKCIQLNYRLQMSSHTHTHQLSSTVAQRHPPAEVPDKVESPTRRTKIIFILFPRRVDGDRNYVKLHVSGKGWRRGSTD